MGPIVNVNWTLTYIDSTALENPSESTPLASSRLDSTTVNLVKVTAGGRDIGASSFGIEVNPRGTLYFNKTQDFRTCSVPQILSTFACKVIGYFSSA